MSDRLAIMRAGRIVQIGSPSAVYQSPASRFVADFLGDANFLVPQSVNAGDGDYCAVRIFDMILQIPGRGERWNGQSVLMCRPEHVQISAHPIAGAITGKIVAAQFKSGAYRWQIALPEGQQVAAQSPRELDIQGADNSVWLTIDTEHARLLQQ
jgi:ABC-type Fe3+/spermidine/putrescine transport system ATPase subunit